jgi:hypothetical protein
MFQNPQLTLSVIILAVAVASAIAAFSSASIYLKRSRRYKELAYEISPTASVVVGKEVKDTVVIAYEVHRYKESGEQDITEVGITNLEAVVVTIHNTGTEGIIFPHSQSTESDDTQRPVTIDFGHDAHIIGHPEAATTREEMNVRVRLDSTTPGRVLMDEFLLNPEETVSISTFLADYSEEKPNVHWHIEDVRPPRELKRERGRDYSSETMVASIWAIALTTGIFVQSITFYFVDPQAAWLMPPAAILAVAGITGIIFFLLIRLASSRKEKGLAIHN